MLGKICSKPPREFLDANGFKIDDLRALGTDGAANMQGEYRGVKARVAEVNPFTKSVHCACHALNLVLVQACRGSVEVKLFFATLEELYSFIEASPKRHDQFKKVQEELQGSAIDLHEAFQLVDTCVKNLRSLRDEALLEEFIQQARYIAEKAEVQTSFAEKGAGKRKGSLMKDLAMKSRQTQQHVLKEMFIICLLMLLINRWMKGLEKTAM
eukprot:Seg591.2 transcript_id=Seg591.2/GoldUCD/mRNA.D3Y31 product="hypothetical protein" protein_id=Seg591.2/GoldUCD/D3Y31